MYDRCIDISHWNGTIKWTRVPADYHLVFIKATEGIKVVDPRFSQNLEGCLYSGRLPVPYHFISREPANLQAQHFADIANLKNGSAAMLDWESADPKLLPAISLVEEIIRNLRLILRRDPLIYHGIYTLSSKTINSCPWHVPKYGSEPKHYPWLFWQDRPNLVLDGIPNPTDHDLFKGSLSELKAWWASGTLPKELK